MVLFKENCRLCQMNVGTILLQDDLCQIILEVAKIEVKDVFYKLLPTSICLTCNNKILEVNTYIKNIQKVNKSLKNYIETNKYEHINTGNSIVESNSLIETTYPCNMCPTICNNKKEYKKHLIHHLNSTGPFVCEVCFKQCTRKSNYIRHKKIHPELYCSKCHIFFDDQEKSEKHTCKDGKRNEGTACLKAKIKIKSGQILFENIKTREIKSEEGKFQCTKCWKEYDDEHIYAAHLESNHKYVCDEENCSKVYTSSYSLKTHKLVHEGRRSFLCVICGKDFISKKSLMCHEKIHSAVKDYNCEMCKVSFSVRSNLRAHIKTYHECIRFHCSQCPKEFMSKCTLDRHEKIHVGIKEFKCDECTSAFYTKKELIKHQRYHQGIRLHKCEICFKTFFERHHLITHIRSHNGERPFICGTPHCSKSFYDKQKLRRHQRTVHISKEKVE